MNAINGNIIGEKYLDRPLNWRARCSLPSFQCFAQNIKQIANCISPVWVCVYACCKGRGRMCVYHICNSCVHQARYSQTDTQYLCITVCACYYAFIMVSSHTRGGARLFYECELSSMVYCHLAGVKLKMD